MAAWEAFVAAPVAPPVRRPLLEVARLFDQYHLLGVALAPQWQFDAHAVGSVQGREDFRPHFGARALGQGGDVSQDVHAWVRVRGEGSGVRGGGLGFRVQGLGFRAQGVGCRV